MHMETGKIYHEGDPDFDELQKKGALIPLEDPRTCEQLKEILGQSGKNAAKARRKALRKKGIKV